MRLEKKQVRRADEWKSGVSGSARTILQVNALATQTSTTAIRRSVAHMPLSWRNQSADVCIACSQQMTSAKDSLLPLPAKCLLYHEKRAKDKLKICAGRDGFHSQNDDSICDLLVIAVARARDDGWLKRQQ